MCLLLGCEGPATTQVVRAANDNSVRVRNGEILSPLVCRCARQERALKMIAHLTVLDLLGENISDLSPARPLAP